MSPTVGGATVIDSQVADYLRATLGKVRTEGWGLTCVAGEAHTLRARLVVEVGAVLGVIERLLPHTKGFTVNLVESGDNVGSVVFVADLLININDVLNGTNTNREASDG